MMEGTFRRLMMRAGGSQLSDAAAFLASYGPFGMAMDFTDASIAINDEANTLDYSSVGTIQDGTGLPLGPGSKLTYSAPSLKFTEQADGYLGFQAHNLYLNSATPANQSITVISGATYAITLTGSVSVTASGAATGTWTAGTNTFTAATTTLTLGSTSGSGTVHVRRTPSVSTYVDTTGAVKYDLPYVFSGGVRTGILVEPAATNLATNNTLASVYGGTQAAASDVTTSGPISDLTTMIGLTDNGNNANHGLYNNAVNTASATDYAISAIVKPGARNYAGIGISVDANNYICAVFDLSSGTFGQTSVGGTSGTIAGSGTAYGIVPLANGCYRIWIAGRVTGLGTPHVWAANAASGNSFGTLGGPTYTGNGTVAIYTTVLQVETGTVATSPIITYGSSGLRFVDNITLATSLWPYQQNLSIFIEWSGGPLVTSGRLGSLYGAANTRYWDVYRIGSVLTSYSNHTNAGGGGILSVPAPADFTGAHKYAGRFEDGSYKAATDGTLGTADADIVVNVVATTLALGAYPAGSSNGVLGITRIAIVTRSWSDAELQGVTTL